MVALMRNFNEEAPAQLLLRRPGVLRLRPSAAISGAVQGAWRAARPGGSGRAGQGPPGPREARARARSRTAGPACEWGSVAAGQDAEPSQTPRPASTGNPPTGPQKGPASNQPPGPARARRARPSPPCPGGPPGSHPAPLLTSAAQSARSPGSSGGARTGRPDHTAPPHLGQGRGRRGRLS